jgi:hypothetical protein
MSWIGGTSYEADLIKRNDALPREKAQSER